MDPAGALTPVRRPVGQAEMPRDPPQPLAPHPAHDGGEGVDARAASQLPQSGVRLIERLQRALSERLEPAEQRLVALGDEPAAGEDVPGRAAVAPAPPLLCPP